MAKQSGLHQIRGKVGEHSYYRQTGVAAGLIRGINQGLSSRVKNGDEYVNTRLNNAEFGAACQIAGLLGKCVVPKFRPMMLAFSQSKMAKSILELARTSSEPWGQRVVPADSGDALVEILNSMSKRDATEFGIASVSATEGSNVFAASFYWTEEQASLMKNLGIDGVTITVCACRLATGKYKELDHKIVTSRLFRMEVLSNSNEVSAGVNDSVTQNFPLSPWVLSDSYVNKYEIACIVIQPFRSLDGINHILQEYCSFQSFIVPRV